jgi:ubiquinone/menaquinone biosynthesis C-methylase UbiE
MLPSTFVDPKSVVRSLPTAPRGVVADFGCGAGYFSVEFARAVGDDGEVIAIDVLPSALEAMESQIKTLGIKNIRTKRANLEREGGSGLQPGTVDWVVAKDILFQNQNKEVILREIARVLRPGGHALVMEWSPESPSVGPDAGSRLSSGVLKELLAKSGLHVEQEIPVGAFHYAFLVTK